MKFIYTFLLLTFVSVMYSQTCDLELTGYTAPPDGSGLHIFTVNFINTENCGCNEYTQTDGNDCESSTSTHVNNNDNVTHIVFGLHYVNEITGEDYGENTECSSNTFHPGWSYILSTAVPPNGFNTGSSSTFAINPPFSWDCILENPIEGYCWEVVIWQINLSQTADIEDFPVDGWSSGSSFNQTQMYPDIDLSNNSIVFCPDPPCVNDTIVEYITDTIVLYENVYVYDTITQYVNLYDTLYIDNYVYDTTYVEVLVDNYIYVTDTVTEIIVEQIWIDCDTGLPCDEGPYGIECPDWTTVHIPNTFTPNNDGLNDVWKIIYDLDCWEIEFWVYNRWGGEVYHNHSTFFESYPYWNGSVNGGNHYVSDGVYSYKVIARRLDTVSVIEKTGHITVLR